MEIKQCKASELTAVERRKCASLSLRQDGDLYYWLRGCPESAVVTVWDGDVLLGWGMRTPHNESGYYVRASMRRKGIGVKIYYALNPPRKRVEVYPHDRASAAFFYSLGKITKEELQRTAGASPKELGLRRKSRREVMENGNSVSATRAKATA